jgi:hypothetical protein
MGCLNRGILAGMGVWRDLPYLLKSVGHATCGI